MKQTGVLLVCEETSEDSEGIAMAGAFELRAPEFGQQHRDSCWYDTLQGVSCGIWGGGTGQAGGSDVEVEVDRVESSVGADVPLIWKRVEPPRGAVVRARFASHHTAGPIFHRDDREGSWDDEDDEHRVWWSHDRRQWMSWNEIGRWLGSRPEDFVVEVLSRPSARSLSHQGCTPDGACDRVEHDRVSWF